MQEIWEQIPDLPGYGISNFGRVNNLIRGQILTPVLNKGGILNVGVYVDGRHTTKSVALLVSRAFLPVLNEAFNSPINLDGDRLNCHVDNLMWRPRWFAVFYHRQFSNPSFYQETCLTILETGERFYDFVEPCVRYGLRYVDIILSYSNNIHAWPTKQTFQLT